MIFPCRVLFINSSYLFSEEVISSVLLVKALKGCFASGHKIVILIIKTNIPTVKK